MFAAVVFRFLIMQAIIFSDPCEAQEETKALLDF